MAAEYPWPGGGTKAQNAWYTDDRYVYSGSHSLPSGNLMTDGSRAVLVTHLRAWASGRNAARNIRLGIDGYWTAFVSRPAAGQADSTGWIAFGRVFNPGAHTVYIDPGSAGGMWFGRAGSGSGSAGMEGLSTGWDSSISGASLVVGSPSAPRNMTAVRNSNGTITVSWTPPSDDGGDSIDAYYIARATNSSFTSNAVQTNVAGNVTSYTYTGLTPGTTYYFRVSAGNALNVARGRGSAYSNSASAQSSAAPAAPGVITIVKTSASPNATISWAAGSNNGSTITNYELQRSTVPDFATFDKTDGTTLSRVISLNPATKYYFRVRATNAVGTGPFSAVSSAPNAPTAPSSVGVASINSTSLTASWNAPSSDGGDTITNYELQRSVNPDMSAGTSSNANNLSRTVSGLTALTVYYFRVRATNGIGVGPWSTISSFTTSDTEPPPPPPAVTRGGRLRVDGAFIDPVVRIRVDGAWVEPSSKIRVDGAWVDPA